MRTTIAALTLIGALIAGGAIMAAASGVTIESLINRFEHSKEVHGRSEYAAKVQLGWKDEVGRFAQPKLYENYKPLREHSE